MLMIGERLRTIRESKNLSQGDIEKRTGMLRCYTSRVENVKHGYAFLIQSGHFFLLNVPATPDGIRDHFHGRESGL
jgi:transcriptional regulator with XRE-family HTH domain